MELVIFIGLQGAGKTTFYRTRFAQTHVLVSKDLLRNNGRPGRRQAMLIAEALRDGCSVVVDNTNVTAADRAALIGIGRAFGAEIVGFYFESSVRESVERNAQRAGRERVPVVAIYATAKRLTPPTPAEGFDRLYRVRIAGDGRFTVDAWSGDAEGTPDGLQ